MIPFMPGKRVFLQLPHVTSDTSLDCEKHLTKLIEFVCIHWSSAWRLKIGAGEWKAEMLVW